MPTISKYNEAHTDRDRTPLQPGYKTWNGAALTCQAHIDEYNRLSAEIHRWEDSGRGVPSWLLDSRHRHFNIMCELALESQRLQPIVDRLLTAGANSVAPVYSVFSVSATGSYNRLLVTKNVHDAAKCAAKNAMTETGIEVRVNGVRCNWA